MLGLQINNKIIYFIVIFFLLFINCKNQNTNLDINVSETKNDTLIFKKWLNDTVKNLKINNVDFKVYEDSTLLEIYKTYDTVIDSKLVLKNKDLLLANELIRENKDFSLDNLNLVFEVIHSYEVSQVEKKYDYSLEIKKFKVTDNEKGFIYNYVKGNLISKNELKKEN